MRILVIDDSAPVRARLVAFLGEAAGVDVVDEARDSLTAYAALAARAPDVVVLDLHLPGESGLSILSRIKSAPSSPMVVVLTNEGTEQHRRECLARGADYFFDKATELDRALSVVTEVARTIPRAVIPSP